MALWAFVCQPRRAPGKEHQGQNTDPQVDLSRPSPDFAPPLRAGRLGLVLAIAAAARLLPAIFGFEHYGDAPVRIEIAQSWARSPHLFRGYLEAYQYGPLHLAVLGAAIRSIGDRIVAARLVSLLSGLLGVGLLYRIARRERGEDAALWAGLGLALSPIHIQASTTGASEAVFLAFFLGAALAALEGRAWLSGLLLGPAGLIRYDAWLYAPLFGALLLLRTRDLRRALGACALAAVPWIFWMWVNARFAGDPLAPIHHIEREHRQLAQVAFAWFGQLRWRGYGLVYWPVAICAVATPVLAACAMWGSVLALRKREPGWELAAIGWIPAAYFTFRTAVLGDFRPMSRFTVVAAALSLPFAAGVLQRRGRVVRGLAVASAIATPLVLAGLCWNRNGAWAEWARPMSPIGSVPPGIAQASRFLRASVRPEDVVLLDATPHYLDFPLAFHADLPERQWIRAAWKDDFDQRLARHPPTMAVLLYQGKLGDPEGALFVYRGMRFCQLERFVYASVYRRCGAGSAISTDSAK